MRITPTLKNNKDDSLTGLGNDEIWIPIKEAMNIADKRHIEHNGRQEQPGPRITGATTPMFLANSNRLNAKHGDDNMQSKEDMVEGLTKTKSESVSPKEKKEAGDKHQPANDA